MLSEEALFEHLIFYHTLASYTDRCVHKRSLLISIKYVINLTNKLTGPTGREATFDRQIKCSGLHRNLEINLELNY